MSSKTPDRLDLKILDVLQQDARITNQALADRVALSPSACLARVRALEARGLIRGYRAQVAVDRIRSATIVLAQVAFKQHALREFNDFDRCILTMPEVVEASRISGPYDYLLRVIVHDVHHWKDIARNLLGGDYGVEKILSQFLMDEVKPFSGYPLAPGPSPRHWRDEEAP
ncbi:Lrp/AsnC family transcriptional regulator [Xanthomonas hyacinthi]|uniref:Lrp/AsnC family transcriptional regulator n=1 Tax=Xanthomonas hyacinthi TaxID=56455 RepID=A0A2S7EXT1_9XANT|nr:Lrp/AsnC family transcriptional regulator [Xanthomonas hyacinthi]PPU97909.1 Lrp/AsnC family transcriptional regulator [Xanthomonas hyacinthi]QGY76555.1 Lrp/AsnC family transcriptional regulator [Xanthomonas hyacinthi]